MVQGSAARSAGRSSFGACSAACRLRRTRRPGQLCRRGASAAASSCRRPATAYAPALVARRHLVCTANTTSVLAMRAAQVRHRGRCHRGGWELNPAPRQLRNPLPPFGGRAGGEQRRGKAARGSADHAPAKSLTTWAQWGWRCCRVLAQGRRRCREALLAGVRRRGRRRRPAARPVAGGLLS